MGENNDLIIENEKNSDVQAADELQTEQQTQTKAADIIQKASELSSDAIEKAVSQNEDATPDQGNMVTETASTISNSFVGLPIESLISKPFVAAARGQQELVSIYVDTVMGLTYHKDDSGNSSEEINTLIIKANRPVINQDGKMDSVPVQVEAPLLSLVPIPALTMDEVVVDFDMEVKATNTVENKEHAEAATKLGYKSWFGVTAEITGNITSDSTHKRTTDSSATYTIHARAVQQPQTEGMAKLTSILSGFMEPIDLREK